MNEERDKVNMAQAVKQMLENLPALLDFERLQAKLVRAKFVALVEQGFTEVQALELCKK